MDKKRRRYMLRGLAGVLAVYAFLLAVLLISESRGAGSNIRTIRDALWYSVVTLTTVGYGDLSPVTTVGRLVGLVFLLLSTGIMVTLLGTVVSFLAGEALPMMLLRRKRGEDWYYFADIGPEAMALAEGIVREKSDAVIIFGVNRSAAEEQPDFHCTFINRSPAQLVPLKRGCGKPCVVFLMKENDIGRNLRAINIARLPVEVYARTESGYDSLPGGIHFFHSYDCCARVYWKKQPLCSGEKNIVLLGFGHYGRALLERAILTNVISTSGGTTYHVFGDSDSFLSAHAGIKEVFAINHEEKGKDAIFFHRESWLDCREIIAGADRIVICDDDEERGWDIYWKLQQCYVVRGRIDLRSNRPVPGISHFGTDEEIYTPENVLRTALNRVAVTMNRLYMKDNPGAKGWEELDDALRESKIAAADHVIMKIRILLKDDDVTELNPALLSRAYDRYTWLCKSPEKREMLRELEHLRWLRFYTCYNWTYGEKHDPVLRQDPRIAPYDALSDAQKATCDHAWNLLGTLILDKESE